MCTLPFGDSHPSRSKCKKRLYVADLPELGHGSKLKTTGMPYGSTNVRLDVTVVCASRERRMDGGVAAFSLATVAQLTW